MRDRAEFLWEKRFAEYSFFKKFLKNLVISPELGLKWKFILCAIFLHKSNAWNMVPEIWAKMLLANQIAEFVNQIYISETERCDILDVDTNSWKSRVAWKILG